MAKLELPVDVAQKVVAMLKPRFRPMGVMILKESAPYDRKIMMQEGTLTEDELSFLVGKKLIITADQVWTPEFIGKKHCEDFIVKEVKKGILELDLHYASVMDEARTAAILLGFQYRAKEEGDTKDVMYRDAYHAIPEIL